MLDEVVYCSFYLTGYSLTRYEIGFVASLLSFSFHTIQPLTSTIYTLSVTIGNHLPQAFHSSSPTMNLAAFSAHDQHLNRTLTSYFLTSDTFYSLLKHILSPYLF